MEAHDITIVNMDEMTDLFEERGITLEDVQLTIAAGENSGRKLYRTDDENRFLAKSRLENLNVYVEYALEDDGIRLYTAFAHRVMLISEDEA